jgi:hypothetical protein
MRDFSISDRFFPPMMGTKAAIKIRTVGKLRGKKQNQQLGTMEVYFEIRR